MSERTGWERRLCVRADGKGLVGHAGAVLLRRCADRVGLTDALAAVLPVGVGHGWRERARSSSSLRWPSRSAQRT